MEEIKDKRKLKHWFYITSYTCVLCGYTDERREARYTEKPKDWWDRHEDHETACGIHFM